VPEISLQQLRIRRFLMGVAMYVLACVPQAIAVYGGISPGWVMQAWAIVSVFALFAFYLAFRFDFNLRFDDPSLTVAQMAVAIVLVLFTQVYAGPARGAYLVVLAIIIMFGSFKLYTRQLLTITLLTMLCYGLTLPVIRQIEGERFNLAVELTLWFSFSAFLPFIAMLGGNISSLRKKLLTSNAHLQEVLKQVTELATRDELTGLYNRRYLLEMLKHEKNRADRGGGGFCVCLLDLDHFKAVNDRLGHQAGDQVLKVFARSIEPVLRSTDLFARFGGEEFLLFLPQTEPDKARRCVQRIRTALAEAKYEGLPDGFRVTASIGVAYYEPEESITALLERVDKALYQAKHNGRDRMEMAAASREFD
jgi:diguanylate cyclase (GGDEF)-like protein